MEESKQNNTIGKIILVLSLLIILVLGIWAVTDRDLFGDLRTDTELEESIQEQIILDSRVNDDGILVEVEDDKATLTGSVANFTAHQAALDNALSVSGVDTVVDNLVVEYETGASINTSDENLEELLDDIYFYHSNLESFDINVDVTNGVAELTGQVDALWRKFEAEDEAKDVLGIIGVENKLAVVPTEDFTDERIADDIVKSLENHIDINVEDIDVKVEDNNVTLFGTVDTIYEYDTAENIATYTNGVIDVTNDLVIE